jgi:hypothetical protein
MRPGRGCHRRHKRYGRHNLRGMVGTIRRRVAAGVMLAWRAADAPRMGRMTTLRIPPLTAMRQPGQAVTAAPPPRKVAPPKLHVPDKLRYFTEDPAAAPQPPTGEATPAPTTDAARPAQKLAPQWIMAAVAVALLGGGLVAWQLTHPTASDPASAGDIAVDPAPAQPAPLPVVATVVPQDLTSVELPASDPPAASSTPDPWAVLLAAPPVGGDGASASVEPANQAGQP